MQQLPIFPNRLQLSIFGASELNFCVRYENRWILAAIVTAMVYKQISPYIFVFSECICFSIFSSLSFFLNSLAPFRKNLCLYFSLLKNINDVILCYRISICFHYTLFFYLRQFLYTQIHNKSFPLKVVLRFYARIYKLKKRKSNGFLTEKNKKIKEFTQNFSIFFAAYIIRFP